MNGQLTSVLVLPDDYCDVFKAPTTICSKGTFSVIKDAKRIMCSTYPKVTKVLALIGTFDQEFHLFNEKAEKVYTNNDVTMIITIISLSTYKRQSTQR